MFNAKINPDLLSAHALQGLGADRTVLVVDDSALQRKMVSSMLNGAGYTVLEADCAEAALDLCQKSMPMFIISDWMMPGMTGIEFCKTVKSMAGGEFTYFTLLTSKREKDEVALGLDSGADDFLTKPVTPTELFARLRAGARITEMQSALRDQNDQIRQTLIQLQAAYDLIEQDLQQARYIQRRLIPQKSQNFGAAKVDLFLNPCGHVGGDLVGMFSPNDTVLGFYCIDVSGHGISSALMAAQISGYFSQSYLDQNIAIHSQNGEFNLRPTSQVAQILNDRLIATLGVMEYFTMVYGAFDQRTGVLELVQAGHPHPILLRQGQSPHVLGAGGLPIGLIAGSTYTPFSVQLRPGDRVILYSDGLIETDTPDHILGTQWLCDTIKKLADDMDGQSFLHALHDAAVTARGKGVTLADDISMAMLHYLPS